MSFVLKNINNYICTLTVNRPEALNAMNEDLIVQLGNEITFCIEDDSVGVIIITGSGDKSFIAGADIKRMKTMGPSEALEFGRSGQKLTTLIDSSPKPIIAAINGFALGGGCEISLACHIRVASENANFGQPEVLLGILPGWGGTQRLHRIVGMGYANEIIITGRMVNANEAKSIGLVNYVVPYSDLYSKCEEIALQILKNSPNAIAQSLKCIRESIGKTTAQGLEYEVKKFSELFNTPETTEGLSAFIDKRKPKFRK